MAGEHRYRLRTVWTGAARGPTTDYAHYSREYTVEIDGKPTLTGSADPAYHGDPALANPEDWLLAALSACHMLSYLAIAARARIAVLSYRDDATATMVEAQGGGHFTEAILRPAVVIADAGQLQKAVQFHDLAHNQCFIANSVNFPVRHLPEVTAGNAIA